MRDTLSDLVTKLEEIHESLHRIYRFLGMTPPCERGGTNGLRN